MSDDVISQVVFESQVGCATITGPRLTFQRFSAEGFDSDVFLRELERIIDLDKVQVVTVEESSSILNCGFAGLFKNLQMLFLYGGALRSLEGIAKAKALKKIVIDVGTKNKVALDALVDSQADEVILTGPRETDLEVIRNCQQLARIEVLGGDVTSLSQVTHKHVKSLKVVRGRFEDTTGLERFEQLEELWLSDCRRLERVGEGPLALRNLTVIACNKLNMDSLPALAYLQNLRILDCKPPLSLTMLGGFPSLQKFEITNCKVTPTDGAVSLPPGLGKLWINPYKETALRAVSQKNPEVLVANSKMTVKAGREVRQQSFFESAPHPEQDLPT